MGQMTFFGHACVLLEGTNGSVLVDPWLRNNPLADVEPADLVCQFVALTHGHFDHCEDAAEAATIHHAPILAMTELAMWYERQGCATLRMNIGGARTCAFGTVRMVPALHSSSFATPEGPAYAGLAAGFVFHMDGVCLYHAGDTGLFGDMALLAGERIDIALLPIGGTAVMGPDEALEAVRLLQPQRVIPIHYNAFPGMQQNPESFARRVRMETQADCVVLQPGEHLMF